MSNENIVQRGEDIAFVNAKIDEALGALLMLRGRLNSPYKDGMIAKNVRDCLFELLSKIEAISFELKNYH